MLKNLLLPVLLCSSFAVSAQQMNFKNNPEPAAVPAAANEQHAPTSLVFPSPQFANDVIIGNAPTIDQRNVKISVAFNGWVYAAYNTYDSSSTAGGITIRMSRDNGFTWTTIDSYSVPGVRYPAHDIVVCGSDTNNLVLYLAGVNNNTSGGTYVMFVDRYNATTGNFIGSNFNQQNSTRPVYDVALASDYLYPAVGASPYSVGLLYSTYSSSYDSIVFLASVDGGTTWTVRQPVATTGSYNRNVSLAYGRSVSASNGRYFGAWEQIGGTTARCGHIYTSRSSSTVNSAWIPKVNLDSVSATMINLCRNPEIAVQYNNSDNDSGSCTAVVFVDRDYNGDGSDYDQLGFYNKRSHYTNFWNRLDIVNSSENDMQGDVAYDTNGDQFLAVYYDSTNGKLPYITNSMNLLNPNTWTVANPQVNDMTTNLKGPYPRVAVKTINATADMAWNSEGANGRGVALFDAQSLASGITSLEPRGGNTQMVYPNPANDLVTLNYVANGNDVVINVYNESGELIDSRTPGNPAGTQQEIFETSSWVNGVYMIQVVNGAANQSSRVVVHH